jgi:2'-5' RNA ligase
MVLNENTSMEEPRARGLSLWLMPEGPTRETLGGLIDRLAARVGTTPFAPHVTLLPGLSGPEADVLARARGLAAELEPLSLAFTGLDGIDEHFRCLFFRAELSGALAGAHARAARRFGRAPDPRFDPHLSLVYGDLDAGGRADLRRDLHREIPPPFEARHLHVWRTEGPVGEWRELAVRGLGSIDDPREE